MLINYNSILGILSGKFKKNIDSSRLKRILFSDISSGKSRVNLIFSLSYSNILFLFSFYFKSRALKISPCKKIGCPRANFGRLQVVGSKLCLVARYKFLMQLPFKFPPLRRSKYNFILWGLIQTLLIILSLFCVVLLSWGEQNIIFYFSGPLENYKLAWGKSSNFYRSHGYSRNGW